MSLSLAEPPVGRRVCPLPMTECVAESEAVLVPRAHRSGPLVTARIAKPASDENHGPELLAAWLSRPTEEASRADRVRQVEKGPFILCRTHSF